MANILNTQNFINLPTSSATPVNPNDLVTKAYGDANYGGGGGGGVTPGGSYDWTGFNTYNVNLPTTTLMPTLGGQFTPKAYTDATYGSLAGTNTWSGMGNTFQRNPQFPQGAVNGYIATVVDAPNGIWTWSVAPAGPQIATVLSNGATPTTLLSISVSPGQYKTISGIVKAANGQNTDATGGSYNATVFNNGGTVSLVGSPYVVVNATSTATFNVVLDGSGNLIVQVAGLASGVGGPYSWETQYEVI